MADALPARCRAASMACTASATASCSRWIICWISPVEFCVRAANAHFVGHYSKTAPLLTCPGCFNGSIERQQVGLFGN